MSTFYPSKEEGVNVVLPVANGEAMSLHVEEFSRKTEPSREAVVIMDKAEWYSWSKLKEFDNVVPIMLPLYSPALSPVELVWKQLREDSLANRCFKNYEDIVQSCAKA